MSKAFVLNPSGFTVKNPESDEPEISGQFAFEDCAITGDFVNSEYEDPEETAKIVLHLNSAYYFFKHLAQFKGAGTVNGITATVSGRDVTITFTSSGGN